MSVEKLDFEKLLGESINQLNDFAQGDTSNVEIVTYEINNLPNIGLDTIKELRGSLHATQKSFSDILGVSKRTVESWETGRSKPNGSAIRVIQLMLDNPSIKNSFKKSVTNKC